MTFRRNPPEVRVTSGQKLCSEIIYLVKFCVTVLYSCCEKGCPTKPYATMSKGIMGNMVQGL